MTRNSACAASALWLGLGGLPAANATDPVGASACGASLGADTQRLSDPSLQLVFKASPSPIPVGRHFQLDFAVCEVAPAPAPGEVRVDAHMPEHRHGMNYRPGIRSLGPGLYRAEGLMFHMPGRWELVFDVRSGDRTVRLAQALVIE